MKLSHPFRLLAVLLIGLSLSSFLFGQQDQPDWIRDFRPDFPLAPPTLKGVPDASPSVKPFPESHPNRYGKTQVIDPFLSQILQDSLDKWHQSLGVKGLSAAVSMGPGNTWAGTQGISAVNVPLDSTMPIPMGSISKVITAACIFDLIEDGLLELTDTLPPGIGTYNNIDPGVTVSQLLRHQSGIFNLTNHPNFGDSINADPSRLWTAQECLTYFVDSALFAPGNSWAYSNTNTLILSLIIEEVTGLPYIDAVKNRVITPTGINGIGYLPYDTLDLVHVWHDPTGQGFATIDLQANGFDMNALYSAAGAAGSWAATPEQLGEWMYLLHEGSIISNSMLSQMWTTVTLPAYFNYGHGIMEVYLAGHTGYGHGGDIFYSSQSYHFPSAGVSVTVQCNETIINSNALVQVVQSLLGGYLQFVTVGQEDVVADAAFTIYPNPVGHGQEVWIQQPESGALRAQVYDLQGRLVWQEDTAFRAAGNYALLGAAGLQPGMYHLNLVLGADVREKDAELKQQSTIIWVR